MGDLPGLTDREKADILLGLPDWMNVVPGFRFIWDESVVMVIGWGGWRTIDVIGDISMRTKGCFPPRPGPNPKEDVCINETLAAFKMKPATLLGTYKYKGEWYLCSIPDLEETDRQHLCTIEEYEDDHGYPHKDL